MRRSLRTTGSPYQRTVGRLRERLPASTSARPAAHAPGNLRIGRQYCSMIVIRRLGALALAACAALALFKVTPITYADGAHPVPMNGLYNVFVDFSKQTFSGVPTRMESKTFAVLFTTHCDRDGCLVRMDNSGDTARNPGAPATFEYRWNSGRWETRGPYPYLCERMNPDSAVKSVRADYLIPKADGSFFGERTLIVEGAGCPGEGPGVHRLPITVTPAASPPR